MANDDNTIGNHAIPANQAGKQEPNIPVKAGESTSSIRLGNHSRLPDGVHYQNLRSIADGGIGVLQSVIAASGHGKLFGEISEDEAIIRRAAVENQSRQLVTDKKNVKSMFARGMNVWDEKFGKKVTILRVNAGVTKKSKTPCHLVADSRGHTWIQKEKLLKLL